MAFIDFLHNHWFTILAYLIIFLLIYINRKKFTVENKIFFLYKTKWGIRWINKFADNNRKFVKFLGYTAIVVGFIGMLAICGLFIQGLYNLIFVPNAPATVSLVIPGVKIPGSQVFIPFEYGILSLFAVILIHEFGHGIVARAHGVKIKSTGIGLLAILPLAFVEPDEKTVVKKKSIIQHSIFATGPFFNVLLAIVALLLIWFVLNPAIISMVNPTGVSFSSISENSSASRYGLEKDIIYTKLNNQSIYTQNDFIYAMMNVTPNQTLVFSGPNSTVVLVTGANPDNPGKGFLGVAGIKTNYELKNPSNNFWYRFLLLLSNPFAQSIGEYTLIQFIYVLSLGIGLANLLPLGPVDGGRMVYTLLVDWKGKKKGIKWWMNISWITLIAILLLLIVPMIRNIIFKA